VLASVRVERGLGVGGGGGGGEGPQGEEEKGVHDEVKK